MEPGNVELNENRYRKLFSCSTLVFLLWLLLTFLSIAALVQTLVHSSQLPDFSEPHKGFETRGTVLSGRASTYDNLAEASRPSSFLTSNPEGLRLLQGRLHRDRLSVWSKLPEYGPARSNGKVHTHIVNVYPENATRNFSPDVPNIPSIIEHLGVEVTAIPALQNGPTVGVGEEGRPRDNDVGTVTTEDYDYEEKYGILHNHSHLGHDHFCSQPTSDHARLIFSHIEEGQSLWSLSAVQELCNLQTVMEPLYPDICETFESDKCCPVWSFPNYVALSVNKTTCHSITQQDMDYLLELLQFCSSYFHSLTLECETCQFAPQRCLRLSIIRSLMDLILDANFLPPNSSKGHGLKVRYVQMILPVARSTRSYDFYLKFHSLHNHFKHIKLVAMDLGLKEFVFDKLLIQDSIHLGIASLCLVSLLLLGLVRSATIVILGLVNTLLSLVVSYWLYCKILGESRFPFLNLLAVLLLLAVGTDDVLFIAQGWGERCDKRLRERIRGLTSLWLSVAATSLTTSGAMFAARLSSVVSVSLFSIFAGSLMLVHLVMTLLWLLPSMVFMEKVSECFHLRGCPTFRLPLPFVNFVTKIDTQLKSGLLWIVTHLPGVCIILTTTLTIAATYITLVEPRLQAPDSKSFALFSQNHPFERYESDFSESFWYERRQRSARDILPLTWVWGLHPVDSRESLDLQARPNASALVFDDNFDITKPKSQVFLLRFCRQLKRQKFYKSTLGPLLPNCFIEYLIDYMSRRCFDPIGNIDRKPCCEVSKFPFSARVFSLCLQRAMKDLHNTPAQYFMPGLAGPKYDTRNNLTEQSTPRAIVVQFDSSYDFSLSHKSMHKFYTQVEEWTQKMLRSAPLTMKNGFFVSDLQFYDLQDCLMSESLSSVLVAAGISALVLYLSTRNFLVSILAAHCVVATILSSLAILALLDWRLNVLESLTVTMATGLSVDYVLHYAIKYNAHLERDMKIKYLLYKNINPICIATLTTFLTGCLLLTSDILAFNQIGTFIMILSFNSFLYSNFGFLSLLYKFGPNYVTDCEFCRRLWYINDIQDEANVTSQAPLSDSNSVTLTGLPPLSPELHELENMSPTFLEDPSASRANVFDTSLPPSDTSGNSMKPVLRPEVAILVPLLQQRH